MSERLNRDDAPFQDEVWEKINEMVVGTGNGRLCARPILHVEGPYEDGAEGAAHR